MRFHLDQHVDGAIADELRHRGIDVTTTDQAGLRHADDEVHLDFCLAESRVVITADRDFLRLHASGYAHGGIVFYSPTHRTLGEVVEYAILLHECVNPSEMAGELHRVPAAR